MTGPGRAALVVADDLTGATDTGNEFARRGYGTVVAIGADGTTDDVDAPVLVVNTDSRYAAPDVAAARVAAAVRDHPAGLVYKKVDSTLRGNLVAEIDAAVDARGADAAVVAPAFPANGRLTACGYHLVDGALVTDTAAGRDPDAPVADAHLPTLLAGSAFPVRHLPIEVVAAGAEEVGRWLEARHGGAGGPVVVACDAVHAEQLGAVAGGTAASGLDAVLVGSAGLARHVRLGDAEGAGWAGTAEGEGGPGGHAEPRVLGVAGSASPATVEQVAACPPERVVALDVERAVTDREAAAADAAHACEAVLEGAPSALLTSVADPDDVHRALAAGRAAGVDEATVRDRIARALAAAAAAVWDGAPLTGLFVTGGAVATGVLGALGATGVRLTGEAVEDGVPVGRVVGGRADGTPVVTKAGAFGGRTTVNACLSHLSATNGR